MSSINDLFGLPDDYGDGEEGSARRFFDTAESLFDLFGFDTAADNLRRYRSGEGGMRSYSSEEMAAHPVYGDAIDLNRTRFEGKAFTGRMSKKAKNEKLLDLKDGESVAFNDGWKVDIGASQPSTYFAFGRTGMYSDGNFEATRSGDRLIIRGAVENSFGKEDENGKVIKTERFDFNPRQIGGRQGWTLEDAGEASQYDMRYDTKQDVEAEVQYEPDGSLTLLRSTWDHMK